MMRVRPVRLEDHDEILELARLAGIGMTSLPPDSHVLKQKIARAVASFAGSPEFKGDESFLFVLEDTSKNNKLIGTTGVIAHVGLKRPFYSYKLSTIVQASLVVDVYSQQKVLHMVNDYTGASEIGSLFILPEYRRDGIGKFLSRCRYLMLAEFPEIFSNIVISEIRGVQDANGESPFYNNLAKHFFMMDFKRSDFIYATQGGQFIADLMPKYPIYVNLLPEEAQGVIGQPFEASMPAKRLLEQEGFRWQGYLDVFDAGPTMQAERTVIRAVRKSRKAPIVRTLSLLEAPPHMISNTDYAQFSMVSAPLEETPDGVVIAEETAALLNLKVGDMVRHVL